MYGRKRKLNLLILAEVCCLHMLEYFFLNILTLKTKQVFLKNWHPRLRCSCQMFVKTIMIRVMLVFFMLHGTYFLISVTATRWHMMTMSLTRQRVSRKRLDEESLPTWVVWCWSQNEVSVPCVVGFEKLKFCFYLIFHYLNTSFVH